MGSLEDGFQCHTCMSRSGRVVDGKAHLVLRMWMLCCFLADVNAVLLFFTGVNAAVFCPYPCVALTPVQLLLNPPLQWTGKGLLVSLHLDVSLQARRPDFRDHCSCLTGLEGPMPPLRHSPGSLSLPEYFISEPISRQRNAMVSSLWSFFLELCQPGDIF